MIVRTKTQDFELLLNNVLNYSLGFIDGAEKAKPIFLDNLGKSVVAVLGQYIDTEAKGNPSALHHVYEWYRTGSPSARLFNITYIVNRSGLSLNSTFSQSRSASANSNTPFYNKARIMENGTPVVIRPTSNKPLVFEDGGQTVYSKKPITVRNPGGDEVLGSFERVFDEFITRYFTQAFLRASGIFDYIKKPTIYKKNFAAGAKTGRQKGISTGFKWLTNARIEVE